MKRQRQTFFLSRIHMSTRLSEVAELVALETLEVLLL